MRNWLALSFILILSLATGWAGAAPLEYKDWLSRLEQAKTTHDKISILGELEKTVGDSDPELTTLIQNLDAKTPAKEEIDFIVDSIALRAEVAKVKSVDQKGNKLAKEIKAKGNYPDADGKRKSNWIARAFERMATNFQCERKRDPNENMSIPTLDTSWISYVAWILLGAAVLVALFFAIKYFSPQFKRRSRRVGGLMEEDEPERTAPEWIENAMGLAAQQKYREAVRALYLASLVEFDSARVARFLRGETNWEHYRRISASSRYPAGFDFLTPTSRFDTIWYGHITQGQSDVDYFMEVYRTLCQHLAMVKSA
ncbi:MAG: hypothetical protein JST40_08775 [Armatimonadetes bacterium]|nr:hypothetical protein [Armatimonadota bacterium]